MQSFRNRLKVLTFRRAYIRFQTAVARALVFDIAALYVLLLIDFWFRPDASTRIVMMLLFGVVLMWQAIWRIGPKLLDWETTVDVALLLERTHGVDSDLVAALQFDSSARGSAGSRELQKAVIDRAAEISEQLDFRSAAPKDEARRATRHAMMAVLSVALCWLVFPNHASAFWNRLWLGHAEYPTRTRIDEVAFNGQTDAARVAEGEMVILCAKCSGITPEEGIARLRGTESGDATRIVLKRVNQSPDAAVYIGDIPSLLEPVEVSLRIGDAEMAPRRIALLRRPIVELTMEVAAPVYMRRDNYRQQEHYIQVIEGSAIAFSIQCTNDKRLADVQLTLISDSQRSEHAQAIKFHPTDELGRKWHLDANASGLARVVSDCQFRVVIVDEDGLGTYHPIEGAVQVTPDLAPTASVASSHHAVMPNARPSVTYDAEDDFGVGSIVFHARRASSRGSRGEPPDAVTVELRLPVASEATVRTKVHAEHALDLSPLNLVQHDKLLVWIEVTDYRGEWPGVSALSESIELEVLDDRGVVEAILRSDADAEQMLTDAIEKELGLKGDR